MKEVSRWEEWERMRRLASCKLAEFYSWIAWLRIAIHSTSAPTYLFLPFDKRMVTSSTSSSFFFAVFGNRSFFALFFFPLLRSPSFNSVYFYIAIFSVQQEMVTSALRYQIPGFPFLLFLFLSSPNTTSGCYLWTLRGTINSVFLDIPFATMAATEIEE